MDTLAIEDQLKLLNNLGYTLTIDERIKLKLAHIQIMNSHPELDEVKFWGRVDGIQKSYYVMLGLRYQGCYQFPHKTFYWASQDFEFKELPELLLQHVEFAEKANKPFTGDPAKIIVNLEGEGEQEGQQNNGQAVEADGENAPKQVLDQDEEQMKKVPKKNFTELHRLSYVVRAIENDCQVVPQGSYKITAENQLRPNLYFYGLNAQNATDLRFWHHFRAPQTVEGRAKIEANNVVFSSDFLDTLEHDLPRGVWSLQLSFDGNSVSCRNLSWPGYYAFHKLGSGVLGSVYIGEGVKNIDLAFML